MAWSRNMASQCHGWITGPPHLHSRRLYKAGWGNWLPPCKYVPAVDLWNFMDKVYELPFTNEWTCFSKGERNALDFSHLFVCLWKRVESCGRKWGLWVNRFTFVTDLRTRSLAMPCFSEDSCTLSGIDHVFNTVFLIVHWQWWQQPHNRTPT